MCDYLCSLSLTGQVDRNLSGENHGDDKERNIFSVVFVSVFFFQEYPYFWVLGRRKFDRTEPLIGVLSRNQFSVLFIISHQLAHRIFSNEFRNQIKYLSGK